MRILVVEDEKKVARFLERGLKEEGYAVDVARDGETGLFLAQSHAYDLVVLDVLLPGRNGLCVLKTLRQFGSTTRVLLLTARDSIEDRVEGLDSGADDYLVKPFAFAEFLARARALLRRAVTEGTLSLSAGDLEMNLKTRQVTRAGKSIALSSREFAVLEYLLRKRNEVVTRTDLAEHVWDENFDSFSNVIDVTVYHLRDKMDRDFHPKLIYTLRGSGYILRS